MSLGIAGLGTLEPGAFEGLNADRAPRSGEEDGCLAGASLHDRAGRQGVSEVAEVAVLRGFEVSASAREVVPPGRARRQGEGNRRHHIGIGNIGGR